LGWPINIFSNSDIAPAYLVSTSEKWSFAMVSD